jgi:hypothetical protein
MINPLPAFKLYLEAKNYQPTTVKNYIADTNIYLRSVASQNPFSPPVLSAFMMELAKKNNNKRYLASLKKFCQFASDQHLCPPGIFKTSLRLSQHKPSSPNLDSLLTQFEQHLTHKNRSSSTVKNYINDLQQYIEFCQKQKPNP